MTYLKSKLYWGIILVALPSTHPWTWQGLAQGIFIVVGAILLVDFLEERK